MATRIKHVYGNVLRVAIPLTMRVRTLQDGKEVEQEEDFYPNPDYPVTIDLYKGGGLHKTFPANVDGNVAHFEDDGTIPVGVYQVEVTCRDKDAKPVRYMARSIIEIVDATADANIEAGVEFNSETYTLDGSIFFYARGKSSYEIWLEQGNEGSEDDFLRYLGLRLASEETDGLLSADYFAFLENLSKTQIMDVSAAEQLVWDIFKQ